MDHHKERLPEGINDRLSFCQYRVEKSLNQGRNGQWQIGRLSYAYGDQSQRPFCGGISKQVSRKKRMKVEDGPSINVGLAGRFQQELASPPSREMAWLTASVSFARPSSLR
jgi:hypothetical protein